MTKQVLLTDLREHPAVKAWARLRPARVGPTAIVRLKKKAKGQVYRLEGVGPGGSAVIAKRSFPERIRGERAVYEEILPKLPVPVVRCLGAVEEPDGTGGWLFLEDAGQGRYSPLLPAHRELAGRWLALLHTSAARLPGTARLPDRGPGYYLGHLRSARATILANLDNPALSAEDVAVLAAVVRRCEAVAPRWGEVEQWCGRMPRTFIHGDFAPKNMRVRAGPAASVLLPFDWGSAGWGVPAADLVQAALPSDRRTGLDLSSYWASPDLAAYCSAVGESGWRLDVQDVRPLAVIGKLFRCLVCMNLDAQSLATAWVEDAVRNMRVYEAEMADAIRAAGWQGPGEGPVR
jgi:aminoglycoside phosphotransferase (APT) family kinase protein